MKEYEDYLEKVFEVLSHPQDYQWSVQGLGMYRVYLDEQGITRMHIWDDRAIYPGATPLHSHPWRFSSITIAGLMVNRRFKERFLANGIGEYIKHNIYCGCGGGRKVQPPYLVHLQGGPLEFYGPGNIYHQEPDEIHLSIPARGTITIIEREVPEGRSPDEAYVYAPADMPWISAEPRDIHWAEAIEAIEVASTLLEKEEL